MKVRTIICILAALFVFSGASPWEGAAVTAPEGELPVTGRYIATNSFPRNTIVDITNIETNRSTRVIVAKSLNSPGLLAIVSREAAELIGMRPGSVSRIRMIQPSDPIAYSRFTEGIESGIPEFDFGRVMTEEELLREIYGEDAYRLFFESGVDAPDDSNMDRIRGPSYILEPEWGDGVSRDIIDLPGFVVYPDPPVEIAEQPREEIITYVPEQTDEIPDEVIMYTPQYISEIPQEEAEEDIFEIIWEQPQEEVVMYAPPETEPIEIVEAPQPYERTEYYFVSTGERPPENNTIYGIDPSSIIPGLSAAPPVQQIEIQSPPVVTAVVTADTAFSIPRIFELDRGRYYVQIAAVDSPESVENTVNRIDRSYGPVVYKDSDSLYRVLLGPLNQGESAAVLQRFKSIGFKDAFVRQGGR